MKKYFEQAIAFDRDNPLNQRTGLGKKYNELVDEYNALEEKYNELISKKTETITTNVDATPTKKSDKK